MGWLCKQLRIGVFSERYDEYFKLYCKVKDWKVCKAVAWIESGYGMITGALGEIGIMQIMPITGEILGYTKAQLHIEEFNVACGCEHLKNMYYKYGNVLQLAIIAYNWGGGNLDKHIDKYGSLVFNNIPKNVQEYWNYFYRTYITLKGG